MARRKNSTGKKSTQATVAIRVKEVIDLLLAGALDLDILHYASENGWKVCERQVRNYISKANDQIAASLEKDRPKLIAYHLARRRRLSAKADQVGDYRTALACLRDEAELENLYPAKRFEHSGSLDLHAIPVEEMTLEQLRAERAATQAAIADLTGGPAPQGPGGRGDGTPAEGESEP